MPERAMFGPPTQSQTVFGPQFRSMLLPSSQDQAKGDDDDNIIYSKSAEIVEEKTGVAVTHNPTQTPCKSDHAKPRNSSLLQLHTLCMPADFDLKLGWISQQFEDSLDNETLLYNPIYAAMNISINNRNYATPGDDLQHNIANPLSMDGYSVYGEQVHC